MGDVASMTGFADATKTTTSGTVTVEIRSVNGRFLELSLRLPDEVRATEPVIRERIGAAISRGKLDCRVALSRDPTASGARINPTALTHLLELGRSVAKVATDARPLDVGEILRWPGVIETGDAAAESWREPLLAAFDEALQGLRQSRLREGAQLRTALRERCTRIDEILVQLRTLVPRILAEMERRLNERMTQALGNALAGSGISREDLSDRIRQELTMHGMRADVAEEMDRLGAHVAEVRRTLDAGGGVGRRLDFLMQELNREANTIASKASAIEMTTAAVELKLLIEQMREQVQNLE